MVYAEKKSKKILSPKYFQCKKIKTQFQFKEKKIRSRSSESSPKKKINFYLNQAKKNKKIRSRLT